VEEPSTASKADMRSAFVHVRFGQIADICLSSHGSDIGGENGAASLELARYQSHGLAWAMSALPPTAEKIDRFIEFFDFSENLAHNAMVGRTERLGSKIFTGIGWLVIRPRQR
jgi:hypothetical protein